MVKSRNSPSLSQPRGVLRIFSRSASTLVRAGSGTRCGGSGVSFFIA